MSPPTEALQRITRLAPLAEVRARIEAVAPVAPREVSPAAAIGATLAADVAIATAWPPVPTALCDGWAVAADAVCDAGPYAPVPLAPAPPWVETGQTMPPGTDAVLPLDAVSLTKAGAEAHASAVPGLGVLLAGEDAEAGGVLRAAGECLRPLDATIFRAAGLAGVSVRRPRVKIYCATVPARSPADTLSPLIAHAIEREGGTAEVAQSSSLEAALVDHACDAVVTVGGTGTGRRDSSVRTLARVGKVEAHGIGINPGETAAFGVVDSRPVLMLPGRLDSALVAFLLVGRALLARLTGRRQSDISLPVTLARKITSTVGIADAVFVQRVGQEVEPLGSGVFGWGALARADGWVEVPAESEGFAAGTDLEMRPLP